LDNIKKYVDISKLNVSNVGEQSFTLNLPAEAGHILVNNQ
jgi:hypothetical protein